MLLNGYPSIRAVSRLSRALPQRVFDGRAPLHASRPNPHGEFEWQEPRSPEEVVRVNIVTRDGAQQTINGKIGDNLLYLAHRYQKANPALALEGSCEASLACSTCHVIVSREHFDILPKPKEDEDDMLDEAACLTPTSRLGCQIFLSKELDGMTITLPAFSKNFYVDGHVPEPH
mmetsp:Transcript_6955/g.15231  ORF Transcript_6955/g.15231 Transcript_6955/m.15231 type:complete len:174 (-) Transcript_6955:404-925(-)